MDTVKKQNRHGDTSSDTAVSLKKGDFITPSVNPVFQKENGGGFGYSIRTAAVH